MVQHIILFKQDKYSPATYVQNIQDTLDLLHHEVGVVTDVYYCGNMVKLISDVIDAADICKSGSDS